MALTFQLVPSHDLCHQLIYSFNEPYSSPPRTRLRSTQQFHFHSLQPQHVLVTSRDYAENMTALSCINVCENFKAIKEDSNNIIKRQHDSVCSYTKIIKYFLLLKPCL